MMVIRRILVVAMIAVASLATPTAADTTVDTPVSLQGDVVPGALIIGTAAPGSTVVSGGQEIRVSGDGTFLLGLGRDATGDLSVTVTDTQGISSNHVFPIGSREYNIQRIDGLPKKQVTPDPETLERIGREFALIKEVRKSDGTTPYFASGFQWPATGPISGVYGSQRILNGEPRRPHNGVDIAAPIGTPVLAMTDGVVALVHEDMFYTGMTVMLDHGHGLTSVYIHMSDILVTEGQVVSKGTPIGKIGNTGRTTGPHLHWGVTLFSTHLDPALLVGPMPEG